MHVARITIYVCSVFLAILPLTWSRSVIPSRSSSDEAASVEEEEDAAEEEPVLIMEEGVRGGSRGSCKLENGRNA